MRNSEQKMETRETRKSQKKKREAYYKELREIPASESAKARATMSMMASSIEKSQQQKPTHKDVER